MFAMATNSNMEFVNSWTLMSTALTPVCILASYLMFVLKLGPSYMKDKKPYQLKEIVTIYNTAQVFISGYLIYVCGRMLVIHGFIPKTCALETEESRHGIATGMHCYLLAKVSELLDTIFFVLRKKDRQISFLHVYHHTLIIVVTWTALKYEPSIHLLFLGVANSFVHIIMYSYYGLSSYPHLAKYLWWKKYITKLQLVQFVTVMTQFLVAAFTSECAPSYILTMALMSNGFIFIYLFSMFYLKNYMNNNSKIVSTKQNSATSIHSQYVSGNSQEDAFDNKNGILGTEYFDKTHKDLFTNSRKQL